MVREQLNPQGHRVEHSAAPQALWGERPAKHHFDREAFARLPPAEQQALRQQRADRIRARVGTLDGQWKRLPADNRLTALREYRKSSTMLTDGVRAQLDPVLARADRAQRQVHRAQRRLDHAPPAQRAAATAELETAKAELSSAVTAAQNVIDAAGLKVDRLARTEQLIDPKAPGSLLDDVVAWFQMTWTIMTVTNTAYEHQSQLKQKEREKSVEKHRVDELLQDVHLRARFGDELKLG